MKTIALFFVLCFTVGAYAQENNIHVAVGSYPSIGAGFDLNKGKNLISIDGEVSRICKNPGGCGHQIDNRLIFARDVANGLYIQGGVVNSYYSVPLFSKDAFQLLGGVRKTLVPKRLVGELNYRHDLTSENKVKAVEGQLTAYLPKHIFVRGNGRIRHFQDFYKQGRVDAVGQVYIGLYF
jgi:hypothetical protein